MPSPNPLLAPAWSRLTEVRAVRGEGVHLYDAEGNRYLDFTSGIGVTGTGHCHPKVVKAVQEQAARLLFGQINCMASGLVDLLAGKLNEITPGHIDRFFFSNSGAEATEASVKLAKAATGRPNTIVFQGSFHGRTHLAMAMTTSRNVYRAGYQPLPGGVFVAPFPYTYRYGWDEESTVDHCLHQLDDLLKGQTAPEETACIIIEPVLGEGGYVPAPTRFLGGLRERCDRHGILLILDEVQTGFGRTGKMFCFEHANVRPDIIVMAKALGSGLPISAIASSAAIMDKWKPGSHGGTYGGGSTLPLAAAMATIDVIREDGLVQNAAERGQELVAGLRDLQSKHASIGDVRGRGLMIGVEFTQPGTAESMAKRCIQDRLLLLTCGMDKNVVRWVPPLVVNEAEISEALHIFGRALEDK
jgi:4-aminobutyrate aminotransferase